MERGRKKKMMQKEEREKRTEERGTLAVLPI